MFTMKNLFLYLFIPRQFIRIKKNNKKTVFIYLISNENIKKKTRCLKT